MVQHRHGKKSPWVVQYRESGSIKTASFYKKEDALEFEAKNRREKQLTKHGIEKPSEELLFHDFAGKWLRNRTSLVGRGLVASTVLGDERRLRIHWLEKFGHRPLAFITTTEIEEQLNHLQYEMGHSASDRNRNRALLHKLFQDALKAKKVLLNPVSAIELLKENKNINRKNRFKSDEEQASFVQAMESLGPHYGVIAMVMLWSGVRVATAIALQWRDINWDEGYITFSRLLDRSDKEKPIQERIKGHGEGAGLTVPLYPALRSYLSEHKMKSRHRSQKDFVAISPYGTFFQYEHVQKKINKIKKELDLKFITSHGMRRTFATNAKKAGYSRPEIREIMGLSSDQVLDRYDIRDVEHLLDKGKRLGFGAVKGNVSQSGVSQKSRKARDL